MDPKELFKKVRRIQIITNRLVDDILAGEYHSAFKGRGMEFDEVRIYQVGDDIRTIDWNVTARTGTPHVKRFCEERELTIYFLVDLSASLDFGSDKYTKGDRAAEIAAVLAFAAIKNNDKVGVILFSDRIEKFLPPRKGRGAVLRIIREFISCKPESRGTNLELALDFLGKVQRRRAVVFLISDFISPKYEKSLKQAQKRYDVIAISISDPREIQIPDIGILELEDAETGERMLVDSSMLQTRELFSRSGKIGKTQRQSLFKKIAVDEMMVSTDRSYLQELHRLFRRRSMRIRR